MKPARLTLLILALCTLAAMTASAWAAAVDAQPPLRDRAAGPRAEPPPPAAGLDEDDRRPRRERLRDRIEEDLPPLLPREQVEQAMQILSRRLPEFHDHLDQLRMHYPRRFEFAMRRVLPIVKQYVELREQDERLAETIIQEFRIEERLRIIGREFGGAKGNPDEQARLDEEIHRLVREQFELRMVRREARLRDFAERLERQRVRLQEEREALEHERATAEELILHRVKEVKQGKGPEGFRPRGPWQERPGAMGEPPPGRRGWDESPPGPPQDEPPRDRPPGARRPKGRGGAPPPDDEDDDRNAPPPPPDREGDVRR